jgi:hypothetical protein
MFGDPENVALPEGAMPSINEPPGSEVTPKKRKRAATKAKPKAKRAKAKPNGNPRKHK